MVRPRTTKTLPVTNSKETATAAPRLVAQRNGRKLASFDTIPGLDRTYLSKVVEAVETHTESLAFDTAKSRADATKAVLTFASSASIPEAKRVIAALNSDSISSIDAAVAHAVELAYWAQIKKDYRSGSSTLAVKIGETNRALSCLASRALWPHTLGLPLERRDEEQTDVRPSLLEAIGNQSDRATDLRGPEVRKAAALRGLQRLSMPSPKGDAELSVTLLRGESECLERLKSAARSVFDRSYMAWQAMQSPIAAARNAADPAMDEWFADFVKAATKGGRDHILERRTASLFPTTEEGLAKFLALLESTYMAGAASRFHSLSPALRAQVNLKLRAVAYRVRPGMAGFDLPEMDSLEALRGLMTPSRLCVGSTAVLLMLETGMNTSPLISLPWEQVLPTDDPRWLSIANWKERAGGSLVEEDLAVSRNDEPTSAGAALLKLREMVGRHTQFVGKPTADKPLVFDHAAGHVGEAPTPFVAPMTKSSFRIAFDAISLLAFGNHPIPAPSAIRPSLLMVLRGHSASVREAQAAAGHKNPNTTNRHYAGNKRAAHHADHMTAIRTFQERLEHVAIHNSQSQPAASADGLNDAIKTGLGVLCIRPVDSEEPPIPSGCMSLEACPNCKKVRLSTEAEDLADLLAFGEHLATHEAWLQTHRPEAWMTRWLYWSLLVNEVKTRGTRSVWAPKLREAHAINASRPKPNFPPLW
ncbi:site-specific integrase [Roseateles koreensis]|uniref:Tyr recombinase domain-containing protein n=1 Tax=Roseateles koreensis TaxID=2987526 RepID=A0ABT5KT17_9BURK|nr:hypothetical protein [Roseateles koreensis]MDC8785997.1 hypothetical protein [Roseateles koreensis]